MTIDLPRSHYSILNPPPPGKWTTIVTLAAIVAVSIMWAL